MSAAWAQLNTTLKPHTSFERGDEIVFLAVVVVVLRSACMPSTLTIQV